MVCQSNQGAWRLEEYPICGKSHTVVRLAVHTQNHQLIYFKELKEKFALKNWQTTLTVWFELNKMNKFARTLKYIEIPQDFLFEDKKWIQRKKMKKKYYR